MNFDQESKSRFLLLLCVCVCVGGGGGWGGGGGGGGKGGQGCVSGWGPYFLYMTYCQNFFYRTVQSHENIPNSIQTRGP